MFYPYISGEDILKIMSGEDRFVRVEIPGPGNPVPKIFLPRGLKRDQSILVQHQIYAAYWRLYMEAFRSEAQHWSFVDVFDDVEEGDELLRGTKARVTVGEGKVKVVPAGGINPDWFIENAAAITIMVFRNPEFLYRLNQAFIGICETYTVNIRLFWRGKEYLCAFEDDPKFEIPTRDYRVCPSCEKRFIPLGRNAWKQRYCTPDHEQKARYRRAYLRREKRQGKLSDSEAKELHGLEFLK